MIPSKVPVKPAPKPAPVVKKSDVEKSEVTELKKSEEKKTVGMSNADFRAKFFN